MSDDDKIDEILNRWDDGYSVDSELAERVRAQAEAPSPGEEIVVWIGNALLRPGLAASFAAVFVLVGMGLSQLITGGARDSREELTLSYRLSIDPIYRLQAMTGADQFAHQGGVATPRKPVEASVLLAGLGWLQGALDLSEPQYRKVSALHNYYEVAFDELFTELVESHREFQALDRKRMENDVIDYFKLYELLQNQKRLSERSTQLTEELLSKVEQVIEPAQRARYRKLLDNIYPRPSHMDEETTDA
ncbi:hypothetical protein [Pelagicoccus sp. SDUM812002]|uniref:hypothetical protein n=1 Tax=Pelagicoccus sp. SDUM812002 TaxID=3041266 RepID=UPI00281050EC|nr:hypothetical protein [Pelagicoccus sp. SDUM812002]MDQ8184494.1 hypothetical protein [Pelagicoccus sp. SDUM812002]